MEPESFDAFSRRMNTIASKVEILLEENEECRNDDLFLIFEYWRKFDDSKLKMPTHKITSPESIRRIREHIQNDLNKYPPTKEEVRRKREIHRRRVKRFLRENE